MNYLGVILFADVDNPVSSSPDPHRLERTVRHLTRSEILHRRHLPFAERAGVEPART